jgi:hypothetical protein
MTGMHISATVFIFKHPDPINFGTWAGVTGTITGVYHWLCFKDSKERDA